MQMAAPVEHHRPDEQTVPRAGRRAAVVNYGSSGDYRLGPVLSSTRGMGQLKELQPCPTAPQTQPCWLSSEATWLHGERPADSWGDRRMPWKQRAQSCSPRLRGRLSCFRVVLLCRSEKESPKEKPSVRQPPAVITSKYVGAGW